MSLCSTQTLTQACLNAANVELRPKSSALRICSWGRSVSWFLTFLESKAFWISSHAEHCIRAHKAIELWTPLWNQPLLVTWPFSSPPCYHGKPWSIPRVVQLQVSQPQRPVSAGSVSSPDSPPRTVDASNMDIHMLDNLCCYAYTHLKHSGAAAASPDSPRLRPVRLTTPALLFSLSLSPIPPWYTIILGFLIIRVESGSFHVTESGSVEARLDGTGRGGMVWIVGSADAV